MKSDLYESKAFFLAPSSLLPWPAYLPSKLQPVFSLALQISESVSGYLSSQVIACLQRSCRPQRPAPGWQMPTFKTDFYFKFVHHLFILHSTLLLKVLYYQQHHFNLLSELINGDSENPTVGFTLLFTSICLQMGSPFIFSDLYQHLTGLYF